MGGVICKEKVYTDTELQNKLIDDQLYQDKIRQKLKYKMLILGTGESGKSTIVNQILFIANQKLTKDEIKTYVFTLRSNVLESLYHYIQRSKELNMVYTVEEYDAIEIIETVFNKLNLKEIPDLFIIDQIVLLWKSKPIQILHTNKNKPINFNEKENTNQKDDNEKEEKESTIEIKNEMNEVIDYKKIRRQYWNLEAVEYYMTNAVRIFDPRFVPSADDIIMARKRTTAVLTSIITYGRITWTIVDVGGQVNERKKWISQFDDVKCIIYVVNLSDYANNMFENHEKNKMHDSLECLKKICNNPIFLKTPIYLFFNKRDLFDKKINMGNNLKECFPEYNGPHNFDDYKSYIIQKFKEQLSGQHIKVEEITLSATIRQDVKLGLKHVQNSILQLYKDEIEKANKELNILIRSYTKKSLIKFK